MSTLRASLRGRIDSRDDAGVGVLAVILVAAVLSAMTITAVGLTKNNLDNVRGDRQSLAALATSEAGVAQAVAYLRNSNLAGLTCQESALTAPACTGAGPSWTSASNPMQVRIDGGSGGCVASSDCFRVFIATVAPFTPDCGARRASPPGRCYGTYRIHSTGVSGNGPGARRVAVDVRVAPFQYPLGVFSETDFSGNGNVGIHAESVFTGGCIINRQDDSRNGSGFQFQWDSANGRPVLDSFYGVPAGAHAVGGISTQNNGVCGQKNSGGGPIHEMSICNTSFKYDSDNAGGPLTAGDGCYGAFSRTEADGTVTRYPTTSRFTAADLQSLGYRPRGLTDAQYAALKTQAQAQGTYNLSQASVLSTLTALLNAGVSSPVLYWDNGSVSLAQDDFPAAFSRAVSDTAGCAQNTVTIIVSGAGNNLSYRGGNTTPFLSAALFVPDGTLTGQGGRNTIGTIFAKTIDLGGNIDFYLDKCYAASPPGGTLDVEVVNFREDDSTDFN